MFDRQSPHFDLSDCELWIHPEHIFIFISLYEVIYINLSIKKKEMIKEIKNPLPTIFDYIRKREFEKQFVAKNPHAIKINPNCEFVKYIVEKKKIDKDLVSKVINTFFGEVKRYMIEGYIVNIPNFGYFYICGYNYRMRRNGSSILYLKSDIRKMFFYPRFRLASNFKKAILKFHKLPISIRVSRDQSTGFKYSNLLHQKVTYQRYFNILKSANVLLRKIRKKQYPGTYIDGAELNDKLKLLAGMDVNENTKILSIQNSRKIKHTKIYLRNALMKRYCEKTGFEYKREYFIFKLRPQEKKYWSFVALRKQQKINKKLKKKGKFISRADLARKKQRRKVLEYRRKHGLIKRRKKKENFSQKRFNHRDYVNKEE